MRQLLTELKESAQDFEFYPTTEEIISKLVKDIDRYKHHDRYKDDDYRSHNDLSSVLDIGAGNGKVLKALRKQAEFRELYAMEKSSLLCEQLDANIFIIGTDFKEQSLLAKQVDMIFCNPPYSEFNEWAVKIIREAAAVLVYLVIPIRWQDSSEIADALKYRDAKTKIVGTFDFENAEDRQARAKVHLLRIELAADKDDAFDRFFAEQFAPLRAKFESKKEKETEDNETEEKRSRFDALVVGPNYPERLVALYNEEIDHIRANYDLVAKLDADLLREFDVTPARILECLKKRLSGLRNTYWKELFSHMSQVTDRLTSKKRQRMMDTLQKHGHVDFTVSNIHAVVIWVLKNANNYLDEQLIETFETMLEKANVRNYKSNLKPFVYDRWRYSEEKPTHVALEYRIVLEHSGGIGRGWDKGLEERAAEFLGDVLTVARNLGFQCVTADHRFYSQRRKEWTSGQLETFECALKNERIPLFEVRAFLNGNMHIRFNQKFALALNVEYGRLKGWLASGAEAAEELQDDEAPEFFQTHLKLGQGSLPLLLGNGE